MTGLTAVLIVCGSRINYSNIQGRRVRMNADTWNRFAPVYDIFMKKDTAAYEQMYELMKETVKDKNILELATGTGLIAKNIVKYAKNIEATDFSPKMIEMAGKDNFSSKLHFSVQDACNLPYSEHTFDVVIISNALHIMPEPEKALREIRRVLKKDGILIAPTFIHGKMGFGKRMLSGLMGIAGFHAEKKWTFEEYMAFLSDNGWIVQESRVLKASFPLTYVECIAGN